MGQVRVAAAGLVEKRTRQADALLQCTGKRGARVALLQRPILRVAQAEENPENRKPNGSFSARLE
jgi:hypothetical protein